MGQVQHHAAQGDAGQRAGVAFHLHGQQVGVADEVGDEAVGRAFVQLPRGAVLHDGGAVHHDDAVRDRQRFFLVVGHVHHGQAKLLL